MTAELFGLEDVDNVVMLIDKTIWFAKLHVCEDAIFDEEHSVLPFKFDTP